MENNIIGNLNINVLVLKNFNKSIILKNNYYYVYIYNKNYYCFLKFNKNFLIKLQTNNFLKVTNAININTIQITKYLKQFYVYKFIKIKFTGKGYKIKKTSSNSIILLFNRAHITVLWWNNIVIRRLKKYKLYIKYINTTAATSIVNVRPINIFTKKGLRQSRQIFLKKKGKK